jgi:cob(I)alamin adenosyltransferase
MKGYVQVYTGEGKGKTTAALGLALRAVGAGLRVCVLQFMKGRDYSELRSLERYSDRLVVQQFGTERWVPEKPGEEDRLLADKGMQKAEHVILKGDFDVVILDEILVAVKHSLVALDRVTALIDGKPANVELVLTGRDAPKEIVEQADLVTEMRSVKHYYESGVSARIGIEK